MPGFECLSEPLPFAPEVVKQEFDFYFAPNAMINGIKEYVIITMMGFSGLPELRKAYDARKEGLAAKAANRPYAKLQIQNGDLGMLVTMFYERGLYYDVAARIASASYWRLGSMLPAEDSELIKTLSVEMPQISEILWAVRKRLGLSQGLNLEGLEPERQQPPVEGRQGIPDAFLNEFGQYF